jgi:6-phosphofructokinase 1
MGRDTGFIALNTGIGSGAGGILIPESKSDVNALLSRLGKMVKRHKLFSLVIVAEGNKNGSAEQMANLIQEQFTEYETKVAIIGHLQRGGAPSALDRLIATRMGFAAVEALMHGKRDIMIGIERNEVSYIPFEKAISEKKEPDPELIRMAEILAL